tara:strand:+ start:164427 stop:165770 length:1344 start_codon:yes stop_codon:yes gene_type:complete
VGNKSKSDRVFKFTDARIKAWPAPEREAYLHDTERRNLVVRMSPKGAKTFYFTRSDSTTKSGTARTRIGSTSEWTVGQARDRVDELNGATIEGGGVVPKRRVSKGITLGDAFDAYIAEHEAGGGRTGLQYRRWYRLYLERHARVMMDSIDRDWVRSLMRDIVNAKVDEKRRKARSNGGRATANAVLALLSTTFSYYLEEHDGTGTRANPCIMPKGSKRKKLKFKKRLRHAAMSEDEQVRFINALDTYRREHAVYKITRKRLGWIKGEPIAKRMDLADLLFLAAITGRRRGSIARMKWQDVNLSTATWIIPEQDNKNGEQDAVALHPEVVRLLKDRRERTEGPFVLPGALGGFNEVTGRHRLADPRSTFRAVLEIAGIDNPKLVVHSLRATWITNGLRMKESTESVRHAVGHASIASTAGYAALVDDDKRRVVTAIGDAWMRGREEAA